MADVAERMLAQRRAGLNPDVRQVAAKVKKEMDAFFEKAGQKHIAAKVAGETQSDIESVRKSRAEESAADAQKAPPKDGPTTRRFLRNRDFLKD